MPQCCKARPITRSTSVARSLPTLYWFCGIYSLAVIGPVQLCGRFVLGGFRLGLGRLEMDWAVSWTPAQHERHAEVLAENLVANGSYAARVAVER